MSNALMWIERNHETEQLRQLASFIERIGGEDRFKVLTAKREEQRRAEAFAERPRTFDTADGQRHPDDDGCQVPGNFPYDADFDLPGTGADARRIRID